MLTPFTQKQPTTCSIKKDVLKNFAKFTGKQLCQSLFFKKSCRPEPATFLKKTLWHRCFPENFAKFYEHVFYRTPPGKRFCLYSKIFLTTYHLD